MAFRFDPSSNKGTDQALSFMSSIALDEYKLDRKKQYANDIMDKMKKGGLLGKDGDEEYKPNTETLDSKPAPARFAPQGRSMMNTMNPFATKDKMPFILNPKTAMDFYKKKMALKPRGAAADPSAAPAAAAPQALPPEIRSTSQAVEYLMESQGMDKNQAITYLKQLNAQ